MIPTVTIRFASNWVASRQEPGGMGGTDTLARLFPLQTLLSDWYYFLLDLFFRSV